ncbi:MAG: TlpA family protein disulfide reductase [Chitinispirillaceae bacterium]|jgi:peroxiredoxin|nr:TlpA family protein disulfide reductase [Chitinispirillaceae bacterium]
MRAYGAILTAALIILGIAACTKNDRSPAPDFVLSDLAGNRFYLNGQSGRIVLLNFWSIHCAPCLKEMPELEKISAKLSGKNSLVIGICNDPGEIGYIETLLKSLGVTYPTLLDEAMKVSALYRVSALPATFIIDHRGRVRYAATGYEDGYAEKYTSIMERLIHERDSKK